MKKEKYKTLIFVSVMAIIFLSILFSSEVLNNVTGRAVKRQLNFCEETDKGDNPDTKGNTTRIIHDSPFYKKSARRDFTDFCSYGNSLVEYYCTEKFNRVASILHQCENGCKHGACVILPEE